jgi:ferredoxin
MPKIKFIREEREIEVEKGANLRKSAIKEGIQLYQGMSQTFNCHGFGQCAECRVLVKSGMENTSPPGMLEKMRAMMGFWRIGHEDEVRLACQTSVDGDIEVETQPAYNWCGVKGGK